MTNLEHALPKASVFRRLLAVFVDFVVLVVAVEIALTFFNTKCSRQCGEIILQSIIFIYFSITGYIGISIGKRILSIRVFSENSGYQWLHLIRYYPYFIIILVGWINHLISHSKDYSLLSVFTLFVLSVDVFWGYKKTCFVHDFLFVKTKCVRNT